MDREKFTKELTTRWLGRSVHYVEQTDSTNKEAARLLKDGRLEDGMVVFADRQTAGRGRMERHWHSDGCLTMTVAVEFKEAKQPLAPITLTAGAAAALGVSRVADMLCHIKYPNDILADNKKLGGILTEQKTGERKFILLGIGINVEQEEFPANIRDIAISLRQLGVPVSREEVAASVVNKMETLIDLFFEGGFHRVRPYWLDVNCTIGQYLTVNTGATTVEGKAINIDDDGNLVLETDDGLTKVNTGDFSFRPVEKN